MRCRLFKQTNFCSCFRYVFAVIQFIWLSCFIFFETLISLFTFIITLGCCHSHYYQFRWKWFSNLHSLNEYSGESKFKLCPNESITELQVYPHPQKPSPMKNESRNGTFSVLSQNLWCHYLAPTPCKRERIETFVKYLKLHHYDALIIQEIFGVRFAFWMRCPQLQFLTQELHALGFLFHTRTSGYLPYFGQNGGVMLFSRYPFINTFVEKFTITDELMLRKGFAVGIIQYPSSSTIMDENDIIPNKNETQNVPNMPLMEVHQNSHSLPSDSSSSGNTTAHTSLVHHSSSDSQTNKYIADIPKESEITSVNNDRYLCFGTAHCDPYRVSIILKQFAEFAHGVSAISGKLDNVDIIVGGDFNTRNEKLMHGLNEYLENISDGMYNLWSIKEQVTHHPRYNELKDSKVWNANNITYRSTFLRKSRVWLSIISCGYISLPDLQNVEYGSVGHCLDHIYTNIDSKKAVSVNVVDTRINEVFVSDHMGVEFEFEFQL